MNRPNICPCCKRPLPEMRLGVRISPLKARIFDAVKRAGTTRISGADLIAALGLDMTPRTLKVHVNQINNAIEDTGKRISGRGGYRLTSQT